MDQGDAADNMGMVTNRISNTGPVFLESCPFLQVERMWTTQAAGIVVCQISGTRKTRVRQRSGDRDESCGPGW